MDLRKLTSKLTVSPQITIDDVNALASDNFKTIICNRPDNESEDQANAQQIENAAEAHGMAFYYLPVVPGEISDQQISQFAKIIQDCDGPTLAYCRTGTRSSSLWALAESEHQPTSELLATASAAGYDLSSLAPRLLARSANAEPVKNSTSRRTTHHKVVVIGGGAAGLAVTASLLKRQSNLDIAIVDSATSHFYQPGWTLVGGGVFKPKQTERSMASVVPARAKWYQNNAVTFKPEHNRLLLDNDEELSYDVLVIATGLSLNWEAIPGLSETLGKNGVTSNYRYDLAPYTWQLVQSLGKGTAIFTQPPMPIKCAGAPQKAMYLSCDEWQRHGKLSDINVEFCTAGAALFGVSDYVPALMNYVEKYGIKLNFKNTLKSVNGEAKTAQFVVVDANGTEREVTRSFDLLHVCPPQCAPKIIADSPLSDDSGWVDVNSESLQHKTYSNVYALGDVANTPNAKTAAAVRKQAPVVAENIVSTLNEESPCAVYEGYGSCPLTVERGKIVLAEFGYGGVLQPTFPSWLINGKRATSAAWFLKEKLLPWLYWEAMLKGREWLASPKHSKPSETNNTKQDVCDFKEKP